MGLLSWWKLRRSGSANGVAGRQLKRPAAAVTEVRPEAPIKRRPAPKTPPSPWCELCDLDRRFCVHGLEDRRAGEHVYATRLGSNYHLRQDCNALTVPRAASLGAGGGRSRMSSMTRGSARARGLEPCRICAGGTAAGRRR